MSIYIIRHGETEGNASGTIQFADDPLSERGRWQAKRLAERLADVGITRIVASDYLRAQMTAEFLQAATNAPLEFEPLLRERDFGELHGQHVSVVDNIWADDLEPPGGEDWPAFHARTARAWQAVARLAEQMDSRAGGNTRGGLAVVTHGMVCYSLVQTQLALAPGMTLTRPILNTSLTVTECTAPWTITLLNCSRHIDDEPSPTIAAGV